jgi:hypothetical protein
LPLPLAPLVIVIHVPDRVAAQLQPLGAVTVTVPVPPAGLKAWLVGVKVKVQTPFWVNVKVAVPILSVAMRTVPALLAVA